MLRLHSRRHLLLAIVALAALGAGPNPRAWTQVGVLTCRLDPSIGFNRRPLSMECKFQPDGLYLPLNTQRREPVPT